jgi:outer membrane receptor protein involved in Fe transport
MNKLLSFLAFFIFTGSLIAQEVEEVIVTANKKEQNVQDIPMNITVISEQTLSDRGIATPEDYLRTLAGVSTPGGSQNFTFRGLNTATAQRGSGTTSVFMDEIGGSMTNLFDVERVEVLRGPQGTLYGSNAIGGTIRYITNKPDTSGNYGKVQIGYGEKTKASDSITRFNAMYNLPLTSNYALRMVYTSNVSPGIYKNIQTGKTVGEEDDSSIMVTLGFSEGPLSGMVRFFEHTRDDFGIKEPGQDKPGNADVYVSDCPMASSYWYNFDGDPTCSRLSAITNYYDDEWNAWAGSLGGSPSNALKNYDPRYAHASASDERHETTISTLSTQINYDFDEFRASLIMSAREYDYDYYTDWARIDMDDFVAAPLWVDDDNDTYNTTELRLTSNPGTIEWTVGYYSSEFDGGNGVVETQYGITRDWLEYVMYYAAGLDPADYSGDVYCPPYCQDSKGYPNLYYGSYTISEYSEETSYYAQADFHIDDTLTLTAGIRDYSLEDGFKSSEYGIFYVGASNNGCDGSSPDGVTCSEESGKESDTRTKVALTYKPNENLTLFTTQASGYRPGGNNAALPYFCAQDPVAQKTFTRRYTSDDAKTTEFGMKLRGSNFQFNATYFSVDWTGIIINVRPGCGWSYNFNGGEAETKGWEIDFQYGITDSLSLDFAGSMMTAETSIDIDSLGASAGDRLPNTVEEQWNLGLVYDTMLFGFDSFARLDVNHYGDSYATFAENPNSSSPDYTKMNLNVGMNLGEGSLLQFSIDNLTDERTEAFIYAVNDTSWRPRNWMQWIPPRSVVVKYTYSF